MMKENIKLSFSDLAPEMLEGLQQILEVCDTANMSSFDQIKDAVRASIEISDTLIQKASSADLENWINVKDGFPKNRTYVLIYSYRGMDIAECKHGTFFIGLEKIQDVTHWKPLPKPPKK